MLKRLLLAGVVLLPVSAQAYRGEEYDLYPPTIDIPDDSIREGCISNYCYDDDALVELTLSERQQLNDLKVQLGNVQLRMARIIANAGARQEQKEARKQAKVAEEAARERAWRKQCTVPLLEIGCPPKEGTR